MAVFVRHHNDRALGRDSFSLSSNYVSGLPYRSGWTREDYGSHNGPKTVLKKNVLLNRFLYPTYNFYSGKILVVGRIYPESGY